MAEYCCKYCNAVVGNTTTDPDAKPGEDMCSRCEALMVDAPNLRAEVERLTEENADLRGMMRDADRAFEECSNATTRAQLAEAKAEIRNKDHAVLNYAKLVKITEARAEKAEADLAAVIAAICALTEIEMPEG
jgi:hypothetical protein